MSLDYEDLLGGSPNPTTSNGVPGANRNAIETAYEAAELQNEIYAELSVDSTDFEDLLGGSILDARLPVTWFEGDRDTGKDERQTSLRELAGQITRERRKSKSDLRAIKFARFGHRRTRGDKGALRNNDNVLAVTGVEADHDAGTITLDEAEARIRAAGLAALLVTTSSHREDEPHWRAFFPASREIEPAERVALAARVNGIFDGELDQHATFTLSQLQYVGAIDGGNPIETCLIDGRGVDLAHDLDAIALPKGNRRKADGEMESPPTDESGWLARIASGVDYHPAFLALAGKWAKRGENEEYTVERIREAMELVPEEQRDRRWHERMAKMPGTVADIFKREGGKPKHDHADDFEPLDDDAPAKGKKAKAEPTIDGFPLTEDGVALAFTKRFRDDLRYCHTAGRWYAWDGARWRREETKLAFDWARETCRKLAEADATSSAAKAMSRANSAGGVERFAQADRAFAVTSDKWDRDLWLLGTPGGTVDLRTGEIYDPKPADMITRLTAATPIPLDRFDAARDCPRWLAFLDHATGGDADAIRFIQQWAGYSLTGDTREEALLFVHGPGGSGKSTAINTVADVMGEYATNVATETITATKYDRHSTELARLHGARFARASETEAGRAWAESRLKALTGGDTITARFMRCDDFEFKPQFKLTIIGNHAPRITNVDEAMRRRFNVLPFTHPPQRADSSLKDALQAEFPGILSWAIQGCLDWQQHGLVRPAVVVEATEAYFAQQDTFALWLEECCEVGNAFAATNSDLSHSFATFARQAGDDAPTGSKGFSQLMETRGFRAIKNTMGIRGRGFTGLRVLNGFDDGDVHGE